MTPSNLFGYPTKLVIDVLGQEVVVKNWLHDPVRCPVEDLGKMNQNAIIAAIQKAHDAQKDARGDCCCKENNELLKGIAKAIGRQVRPGTGTTARY